MKFSLHWSLWALANVNLVYGNQNPVPVCEDPKGYFRDKPEIPDRIEIKDPNEGQPRQWLCNLGPNMSHTPDCFRDINEDTMEDVLAKLSPNGTVNPSHSTVRKEFIKVINEKDVLACKNPTCIEFLAELLIKNTKEKIPSKAFSHMTGAQLDKFQEYLDGKEKLDLLDHLPAELLSQYGAIIAKTRYMTTLPRKTQVAILSNPDTCYFVKKDVDYVLFNSNMAKGVTPQCMRNMDLSYDVKGQSLAVPNNAFEEVQGCLSATLTKQLKPNHVQGFASKIHAVQRPAEKLDFREFGQASVAKSITSANFIGRLAAVKGPILNAMVNKTVSYAPQLRTDLFNSLDKENVVALSELAAEDINYLPTALIQALVNNFTPVCSKLTARNYKDVKFNRNCFNRMSGAAQASALLTGAGFDEDILANVDSEKFKEWTVPEHSIKHCKDDCSGVKIFDAMFRAKTPNLPKLIQYFGEEPNGPNPCLDLGDAESISQSNVLAENISGHCFNIVERQFPSNANDLKNVNARLSLLRPYHQLRKEADFFKNLTDVKMAHLISGGQFCHLCDWDDFQKIPAAALKGVTSACLLEIGVLDKLTATQIQAMSASVFEAFPSDHLNATVIKNMTPAQIAHACTSVTDATKNNLGSQFTEALIKELSAAQVAGISASQWKETKAEAFAGLDGDKLKDIKPEAMVNWKLAQVKAVPTSVWASLDAKQASMIGKDAPAGEHPHEYLLGLSEISEEVKLTLREARPKGEDTAATDGGMPIWAWILIGVAGVIVLGGIAYFLFMRS